MSLISVHVWKPQRKLLNPTFNNKILLSFIPVFNEKSETLTKVLDKLVGEKAFDIYKQMLACTLEMVCCEWLKCIPLKIPVLNFDSLLQQQLWAAIWNFKVMKMSICLKQWKGKDYLRLRQECQINF